MPVPDPARPRLQPVGRWRGVGSPGAAKRAAAVAAVVGGSWVLACGGPSEPGGGPAAAVLTLRGPAEAAGEVRNPDQTQSATRFTHTCVYRLEVSAAGGGEVRLTGARWTLTEHPDAIGQSLYATGTLSAAEVASAFGGAAVTAGTPRTALLTTSVTFPAGPEPRGAIGAHRARWDVTYETARQARTATHEVTCTPMMIEALLRLRDERTAAGAAFADVLVGGVPWRSGETGVVRPRLALGVHPYAVQPPRYAPATGTVVIDNNERTVGVARRAPEVEPGGFEAPCDASARCTVRVTVYDPAGAAGLPDRLTLDAAGGVPTRTSTASETLDAYRRRYSFAADAIRYGAGVPEVPFAVVNAAGVRTRYVCERLNVWRCREASP